MKHSPDLNNLNDKIHKIKQLLLELESEANQFPALERNSKRALASLKMLELNISDIVVLGIGDS